MNISLMPGQRRGFVQIPASKSLCHRLFIMAALSEGETNISCGRPSKDVSATISCLNSLGASIWEKSQGLYAVRPIKEKEHIKAVLRCGESGSSLRFLLPVCGILGAEAELIPEGRLLKRPLDSFSYELQRQGMEITKKDKSLFCRGKLCPGEFLLPGNESSQYISALLMALPLLNGESSLKIINELQSEPYIKITEDVLRTSGIEFYNSHNKYIIPGNQRPKLHGFVECEGDYSSAAFFICAGALSDGGIMLSGLNPASFQGDREILNIVSQIGADVRIIENKIFIKKGRLRAVDVDASQIPDLIPALAALLSLCRGKSRIYNGQRLRLKESDRIKTSCAMLKSLGADIEESSDGLLISGKASLSGGLCSSYNDHRIAMAAAVAACGCDKPVIIQGAEAVSKSYPDFWKDFLNLKGADL